MVKDAREGIPCTNPICPVAESAAWCIGLHLRRLYEAEQSNWFRAHSLLFLVRIQVKHMLYLLDLNKLKSIYFLKRFSNPIRSMSLWCQRIASPKIIHALDSLAFRNISGKLCGRAPKTPPNSVSSKCVRIPMRLLRLANAVSWYPYFKTTQSVSGTTNS